jgi:1,4-alpha-glucan branching enzyme
MHARTFLPAFPAIFPSEESVNLLVSGNFDAPHQVLGPHCSSREDQVLVRSLLPAVGKVWLVDPTEQVSIPMIRVHDSGLFQAACHPSIFKTVSGQYKFRYTQGDSTMTVHDPYAFAPFLTDMDLHLFNEGSHEQIYEKLGAHVRTVNDITGVNFAVWAPNAKSISVVGNFNGWNRLQHPMQKRDSSGIWELFIPNLECGEIYKFSVKDANDNVVDKADPFGAYSELPPRTASVVANLNSYEWSDADWMKKRAVKNGLDQPMSMYELHLGSWKHDSDKPNGWMNYREIAHQVVQYCEELGFTHIELMPVSEHPYTGSWGYQTVGYFAATSRYGTPEDFMYFVDYCHQHDIGIVIDWVPAHFPKDAHGLAKFDGTALFEHSDPRQGEHPDWDTLIFNYERNEVRNFLMSNAMFWLDKYHIDGLRVDAVASMLYLDYSRKEGQWIPNKYGGRENLGAIDFLKTMNDRVHSQFDGVLTIAEESTAWGGVSRPTESGGLGFSLKWNMGWMNDTLRYIGKDPIHRQYHHDELTFSLIYAFTENFLLPFSHDEIVHGKGSLLDQMPGDEWQKFANLRLLYSYMWTHPGKNLLFMGCEFGQWNEWDCNSSLQWDLTQWEPHSGLQKLVADLNKVYKSQPALYEVDFEHQGFEWIDSMSREKSVLGYIRRAKDPNDFVVVCANFTPTLHTGYRMGVPEAGHYREIFNSDSSFYGGTNQGNGGGIHSADIEAQGREHSIEVTLPPLGISIFKKD